MELIIPELTFFFLGMLIGALISWLFQFFSPKNKVKNKDMMEKQQQRLLQLEKEKETLTKRIKWFKEQSKVANQLLKEESERANKVEKEKAVLDNDYSHLRDQFGAHQEEVTYLKEQFAQQFENLANRLLEEKSQKFTEQNKESMTLLLGPLQEKIRNFEKKVEQTHLEESQQRAILINQFKNLTSVNEQVSQNTQDLSNALSGAQLIGGKWGELVLDGILEKSGLVKGREYKKQVASVNQNGQKQKGSKTQPDVIVYLPDARHVVIDSQLSLTAYERYASSKDLEEGEAYLKAYIHSLKNHIQKLSEQQYQNLYELNSLDFVLMFIPVESAFALAIEQEDDLFNWAFDKNIILVSPSTLLATLRTTAHIWLQQKQSRNAVEIARESGALYDQFVGFVKDLEEIGRSLLHTEQSYEKAMNKLFLGKGNLVGQAEHLKELGAKTSREL